MNLAANNTPSSPLGSPDTTPFTPSLLRRMACWVYEGLLLFAVIFMAGWLFITMSQMRNAMDGRRILLQGFLFVVFGVYFGWFWHKGQTLAMKTWRIRVVDTSCQQISQLRALARYVLSWLWLLPPLAAMLPFKLSLGEMAVITIGWIVFYALLSRLHPDRQFVHDALAGTRLINHAPMSK